MYELIQPFDFDFISATDHYQFLDEMINYHSYLQTQQHKLPFVITLNADQLVRLAEPKNSTLKQTLAQSLFILMDNRLFYSVFEFYLKVKKRAPLWMQSWGLEWLHRLTQEPKRMWRRYLIGAFRLAWLWIKCFPKERRNNLF